MNEVYFNGPDGVGLTADTLPTDWVFDGSGGIIVDGFGLFDFGITNGMGETDPGQIQPGETLVFTFIMSAAAEAKDFGSAANADLYRIAGKFVNGPGDDSAYGANKVPTPGVLALMGIAGLVAARPRRRRE
jgi:MYXO-CTERM domain-containing protein